MRIAAKQSSAYLCIRQSRLVAKHCKEMYSLWVNYSSLDETRIPLCLFMESCLCPSAQSMSKNPFIERHMLSSTAVGGNVTPFNYVQSDIFPTLTFIRFHNFLTIHFIHILNLCANEMDTIVHALLMSEGRQHWHMLLEHANNNNNALEEVQGKRTMCGLGSMYKQPEPVQLVYTWKNSLFLTTLSIRKFVSALFLSG